MLLETRFHVLAIIRGMCGTRIPIQLPNLKFPALTTVDGTIQTDFFLKTAEADARNILFVILISIQILAALTQDLALFLRTKSILMIGGRVSITKYRRLLVD